MFYVINRKIDNKKDFLLLDIRFTPEYKKFGFIKNSIAFLYSWIDLNAAAFTFDGNKEVNTYNRKGNRSSRIVMYMQEMGYTNVKQMLSGITHWRQLKLSVVYFSANRKLPVEP